MIRKSLSRIAAFATVALMFGTQIASKADRVVNYGYYGNNGIATMYSQLDVRNVGGRTDPSSWFYVMDDTNFYAYGNFDTVLITKDADGTVHTAMKGYGFSGDHNVPVFVEEHLTRRPSGATSLSVQVTSIASAETKYLISNVAAQQAETPMIVGASYFLPGK